MIIFFYLKISDNIFIRKNFTSIVRASLYVKVNREAALEIAFVANILPGEYVTRNIQS